MFERILLICTGNICRSPLAEAMFRVQLATDGRSHTAQVRSAGTKAQPGKPVDDTVLFIARTEPAVAESLQRHRSQSVDASLTWWADLILVMEPQHAQHVLKLDSSARSKLQLLNDRSGRPVPDPYMRHESLYREVHDVIHAAVASWRHKINA